MDDQALETKPQHRFSERIGPVSHTEVVNFIEIDEGFILTTREDLEGSKELTVNRYGQHTCTYPLVRVCELTGLTSITAYFEPNDAPIWWTDLISPCEEEVNDAIETAWSHM